MMNLTSILKELKIRAKEPIGSGAFHTAFPFEKFKDKIIKTVKGDVDIATGKITYLNKKPFNKKTLELFTQYPDLFANVDKITNNYAVIQRLNTKDYKSDASKIAQGIHRFLLSEPRTARFYMPYTIDPKVSEPDDMDVSYFFWFLTSMKPSNTLNRKLQKYVPKDLFEKFYNFFEKVEDSGVANKLPTNHVDAHDDNLGYDESGNIKFLDV